MARITCKLGTEVHTHTSAVDVASCHLAFDRINGEAFGGAKGALRVAIEMQDEYDSWVALADAEAELAYERHLETRDWMEHEGFAAYEARMGLTG